MVGNDDKKSQDNPLAWIGSSLRDLKLFPKAVRQVFGQALFDAQRGSKHPNAKPLKGFGGAGVLEVVEDDNGSTYRAVYTVKFADVVYVIHAFQKKSKAGAKTPRAEIEKIKSRLKIAERNYDEWKQQQERKRQD